MRRLPMMDKISLLLVAVASLAVLSAEAFADEVDPSKDDHLHLRARSRAARRARLHSSRSSRKLTYRRRRRDQEGDGNEQDEGDVIFGMSLEEFDDILTSDVAYEFGLYELETERAEELWEDYLDFQFERAVAAEEDYLSGKEGATLSDALHPYLICSKKAGKTALQRREHIIDIARYGLDLDDADNVAVTTEELDILTSSSIFTVYNSESMSCFLARTSAAVALVFADLQDSELPFVPIIPYMKMRAGAVQEMLRRAFPEYQANATVDEGSFNGTDTVSDPSGTRLEANFCAGMTDDELKVMGERLIGYMKANGTEEGQSLLYSTSRYANITPQEYADLPQRVRFWLDVYEAGIDSEEGCDAMLDRLVFEVSPGNTTGESVGFYASLGPPLTDENTGDDGEEEETTTTVACALSLIAGLANLPQICSVELNQVIKTSHVEKADGVPPEVTSAAAAAVSRRDNVNVQWILQDWMSQERAFWSAGITGRGQVVGASDSGLDTNNCYFWDSTGDIKKDGSTDTSRRKVVEYVPFADDRDEKGGHGTHVCGTIVGHKAIDGKTESTGDADGVARDAKVAFFDAGSGGDTLSIPSDSSRYLGVGSSAGARVHSASWGSFLDPPSYDTMSRGIDQYIYEDWNFLLIVAAGNDGSFGKEQTILSPAVGKNCLTVGATLNADGDGAEGMEYLADFSSRGPTSDNRIAPDVVAPGQSLVSAKAIPDQEGECDPIGTVSMQGTSMATPATAGAALLVRQYFVDGFFPSKESIDPSGMLLKAVLINGAQEISFVDSFKGDLTAYYDNNQGFGRVSLVNSLPLKGSNRFNMSFVDKKAINDGEVVTIPVNITNAGGCVETQMRTTLVWADPPGASGCVKCLVNDLDLSVTKNGEPAVYYPNGRNDKDSTNNIERIIVDAQDGDKFDIKIHAANLDRASQAFALVITGCIEVDYVIGEEQPEGHGMPQTTKIIIIVCSIAGAFLLIGVAWCLCSKRGK